MHPRSVIAIAILTVPFVYIYGLSFLSLFLTTEKAVISPAILIFSLLLNLVVMVGASFLYSYVWYGGPWHQTFHRLYFHRKGAPESLALGILTGFALLILSAIIALVYWALIWIIRWPNPSWTILMWCC